MDGSEATVWLEQKVIWNVRLGAGLGEKIENGLVRQSRIILVSWDSVNKSNQFSVVTEFMV